MHTDSRHVARGDPGAGREPTGLYYSVSFVRLSGACSDPAVTARSPRTGRRAYPTAYDRVTVMVTVRVQRTTAMATAGAGDPGRTRGVAFLRISN